MKRGEYIAKWHDGDPPRISVTGPGLDSPFEVHSPGEDAVTQFSQALDLAIKGATTRVHFRKFHDAENVIALFPDQARVGFRGARFIASYMHVGQHSDASADLIGELEAATPAEYATLQNELEHIGYVLDIQP